MDIHPKERTALFIDGTDTIAACKALGFNIDFKRLLTLFREKTHLRRASYYTLLGDPVDDSTNRALGDWLVYNGYFVVSKPAREINGIVRRGMANSIAVDLTVDVLQQSPELDHIVLFSGLAEYRYLLANVQKEGRRVTVVASRRAGDCSVADELRRQSDQFIDLSDLQSEISLEARTRDLPVEQRGLRDRVGERSEEPVRRP